MKRLVLALSAIAACEQPYSNEDLVFMRSLPGRDQVEITLPRGADTGTTATYYLQMVAMSAAINDAIIQPLSLIDQITSTPPTTRDEDLRSWGPIETSSVVTITLYMTRTATAGIRSPTSTTTIVPIESRVDFVLYGHGPHAPEPQILISGGFAALRADGAGIGLLAVDLDAFKRLDPSSTDAGQYTAFYDNRDGLSVAFSFEDAGAFAGYRFDRRPQSLDFRSFQQVQLIDGEALETVTMLGRWLADNHGRADVRLEGGDLPASAFASECWDERFHRVYFAATTPELGGDEGSIDACASGLRESLFFER